MKAYVLDGPRRGMVREVPIPVPGEGEVLIKVVSAGLCGTDAHIYLGEFYSKYPLIPGHEFAGVVAGVGKGVKRFREGQRVAADPNVFCEKCDYCRQNVQNFCRDFQAIGVTRDGAFAEYVVAPEASVFDIGEMDFVEAAMIEPLACVVYGQQRARPELGATVLIFGAGPIGLLHLQLARCNGASFVAVADIKEERLALADGLGADLVVINDAAGNGRLRERFPNGFDLVIDTTGVPKVVEAAVPYVKNAGTLLIFGVCPNDSTIRLSPYEIYKRDLQIVGSFALKKTFQAAINLLQNKRVVVSPLIGERITLAQLLERMEEFVAGRNRLKTVVCLDEALAGIQPL